jgi:hypothetical protein
MVISISPLPFCWCSRRERCSGNTRSLTLSVKRAGFRLKVSFFYIVFIDTVRLCVIRLCSIDISPDNSLMFTRPAATTKIPSVLPWRVAPRVTGYYDIEASGMFSVSFSPTLRRVTSCPTEFPRIRFTLLWVIK